MAIKLFLVFNIFITSAICSMLNVDGDNIKSVLEEIVKRLDDKEARISQLETTVSQQQTTIADQQILIQQQQITMADQQSTIKQQQSTIADQQQQIAALDVRLLKQEMAKSSPGKSHTATHANNNTDFNNSDIDDFLTDHNVTGRYLAVKRGISNRIRRAENEMSVAFLASLTEHATHLGADQNIAFDNVITNIGSGYHPNVGAFIAPVSGIYVFSTSLMSYGDLSNTFQFQHNGNLVLRMLHRPGGSTYETSSVTVVLQVSEGDDVSVVNMGTDKPVHGNHYCSFTGFLLEQIYDGTTVVGK